MLNAWIDFETRSRADLKAMGSYKYANHWSTEIRCMAWAIGDEDPNLWLPGDPFPERLAKAIAAGYLVHAHNAQFERNLWDAKREAMGWPAVKFTQWRCTAAKAAYFNHPRHLAGGVEMLLPNIEGKDMEGNALMCKMCMPIKIALTKCVCDVPCECTCGCACEPVCTCEPDRLYKDGSCRCTGKTGCRCKCTAGCKCKHEWIDDNDSVLRLGLYCMQDVVVERELDRVLPHWPEAEVKVWLMNERINERGAPMDRRLCEGATEVLNGKLESLSASIEKLTNGEITSGNQCQRIKKLVIGEGVDLVSLDAATVAAVLETRIPPIVRDILQLRQITSGAAAKKFQAALDCMDDDDRARNLFLYYGASATGRFASLKVQLQNMKKGSDKTGVFCDAIGKTSPEEVVELAELLYGDTVITELGKNVRSLICARDGYTLLRCDSSQIECRVLQWLCGNQKMLRMFGAGEDPYIDMAQKVFNKLVTKAMQERQIGKVAVLGLGFGMGAKRFKEQVYEMTGIVLTEKFAMHVVQVYRKANPKVPAYWKNLEAAAKSCLARRQPTKIGLITFYARGKYLVIRLPSGRELFYYEAKFTGEGRGQRFEFRSPRGHRSEWAGGLLCENIVQAAARCTLVSYMAEAETRGLKVVSHIHDELMVECPEDEVEEQGEILTECFAILPDWAKGLPTASELTIGRRYA